MRLQAEQKESSSSPSVATASSTQTKEIGLLTFDLDDTLYPIDPVVRDANGEWSDNSNTKSRLEGIWIYESRNRKKKGHCNCAIVLTSLSSPFFFRQTPLSRPWSATDSQVSMLSTLSIQA